MENVAQRARGAALVVVVGAPAGRPGRSSRIAG